MKNQTLVAFIVIAPLYKIDFKSQFVNLKTFQT
jgi:hypothetical protein